MIVMMVMVMVMVVMVMMVMMIALKGMRSSYVFRIGVQISFFCRWKKNNKDFYNCT